MRILHVIPSVSSARGGPSVLLRTLAGGLAQSGVEVHVATTDDDSMDVIDRPHGIPISDGGATYWYFKRQTHFYTVSLPLSKWLRIHVADYDVVHIHALFSFPSVSAAYWARRMRVPYIIRPLGTLNRWGLENRRPWLKRISLLCLERKMIAGAAAIHYTSEQERLEAIKFAAETKAVIIPNAIERRSRLATPGVFRSRYPELNGRQIILFLSRFDIKKGLDILISAFADVHKKKSEAQLVLAGGGDPELTSWIKNECSRLGVSSHVLFAGFLEGSGKDAALQDADIFVLPSYSENFGIAPAEAMAASVPIVISDQVAIHGDVTDANAGVVVPCNVRALSEALLRLLRDPGLRSELGRNGQALAARRYSIEAMTRSILGLYQDVIAN